MRGAERGCEGRELGVSGAGRCAGEQSVEGVCARLVFVLGSESDLYLRSDVVPFASSYWYEHLSLALVVKNPKSLEANKRTLGCGSLRDGKKNKLENQQAMWLLSNNILDTPSNEYNPSNRVECGGVQAMKTPMTCCRFMMD
jgi:hypothetical protein